MRLPEVLRRPPPDPLPRLLVDLAADRDPGPVAIGPGQIAVALEHRMTGLLWSWGQTQELTSERRVWLVKHDLGVRAHAKQLWSLIEDLSTRLSDAGLDVAVLKGVVAEARFYDRTGERPCSDVDLWLAPAHLGRASEVVAAIQPDHPWIGRLDPLVATGRIQAVTLQAAGIDVDLHFDPFKLGFRTRVLDQLWERTIQVASPTGVEVRTLDDTTSLLHFVLHLNKDRFQRLLGYVDVRRVVDRGAVDWDALELLAEREGVQLAVFETLRTVADDLGVAPLGPVPRSGGPKVLLWRLLWRRNVRLRGVEGRLRFRMRQNVIALLARGRAREAFWWWFREMWPPDEAVELRYGRTRGPYVYRLFRGRLVATWEHRRVLSRRRDANR
jgi:hypothetical protein